jgi:hypothetical protein
VIRGKKCPVWRGAFSGAKRGKRWRVLSNAPFGLFPTGLRNRAWLVSAIAGAAGSAAVWVAMPHGRGVASLWEYAAKLAVFFCVVVAISVFPHRRPSSYLLLLVAFVVFAGYLFPRISYFYYGDTERTQADSFYTHLYLLAYPAMVLTVTAAYRLGGGTSGRCLKIAGTGVLILFSGFLDVMWQLVNPVEIAKTIDAPHIVVITGRPISFGATIIFTVLHLPLLVGLNLLPLDRWIDRLLGPEAVNVEHVAAPAKAAPR